jgi:RNA polymerase sigma-70 factor (family 1)
MIYTVDQLQSDEKAFEILFDLYRNKMYGYAMRICQSSIQAEEIVQNIFLQIWINRYGIGHIENFAGYIRIMARNEALQYLRHLSMEQRHHSTMAKDWKEEHCDTEFSLEYNETRQLLESTLDTLPPQQKLIYNMCHLQGIKQQEVAVHLHISPLTVKSHLRQAVVKVRKAMYLKVGITIFTFLTLF